MTRPVDQTIVNKIEASLNHIIYQVTPKVLTYVFFGDFNQRSMINISSFVASKLFHHFSNWTLPRAKNSAGRELKNGCTALSFVCIFADKRILCS